MKVCWKTEEICPLIDLVEKAKSRCDKRTLELEQIGNDYVNSLNWLQLLFYADDFHPNEINFRFTKLDLQDLTDLLEKIKFYRGAYTLTLSSDESELVYKWTQKDK